MHPGSRRKWVRVCAMTRFSRPWPLRMIRRDRARKPGQTKRPVLVVLCEIIVSPFWFLFLLLSVFSLVFPCLAFAYLRWALSLIFFTVFLSPCLFFFRLLSHFLSFILIFSLSSDLHTPASIWSATEMVQCAEKWKINFRLAGNICLYRDSRNFVSRARITHHRRATVLTSTKAQYRPVTVTVCNHSVI